MKKSTNKYLGQQIPKYRIVPDYVRKENNPVPKHVMWEPTPKEISKQVADMMRANPDADDDQIRYEAIRQKIEARFITLDRIGLIRKFHYNE